MAFVEVFGSFDDDGDDVGAAVTVGAEGYAVTRELKGGAGLGAGGDFHGDFAVYGFHIYLAAKGSIGHGDNFFGQDDGAFASETFVGTDADADVEVSLGTAFGSFATLTSETDGHAVVDAGRDFKLEGFAVV